MRPARWPTLILILLTAAAAVLLARRLLRSKPLALPAASMQHEPRTMLWAWETPEDLTALDPTRTGVAYLSREVLIAPELSIVPRRQPLRLAAGTWLMAVVRIDARIDATGPIADTPALRSQLLEAILPATQQPNVRALQIDFDAAASQLPFYTALLHDLRRAMPAGMPLSITALTSWCGPRSWLPQVEGSVDEAVPMFFRMGGTPTLRATTPKSTAGITQPLCATSLGVALDEPWPDEPWPDEPWPTAAANLHTMQRVYIFRTGPWTADDLHRLNARGAPALAPESSR